VAKIRTDDIERIPVFYQSKKRAKIREQTQKLEGSIRSLTGPRHGDHVKSLSSEIVDETGTSRERIHPHGIDRALVRRLI
jgi:hypothetical protein